MICGEQPARTWPSWHPPLHIAAVANHRQVTKRGVTLGVYVQYDYAKEKRQALEAWDERLSAIIGGDAAKVIPMRGAERA